MPTTLVAFDASLIVNHDHDATAPQLIEHHHGPGLVAPTVPQVPTKDQQQGILAPWSARRQKMLKPYSSSFSILELIFSQPRVTIHLARCIRIFLMIYLHSILVLNNRVSCASDSLIWTVWSNSAAKADIWYLRLGRFGRGFHNDKGVISWLRWFLERDDAVLVCGTV